jgi:hypothetical protein
LEDDESEKKAERHDEESVEQESTSADGAAEEHGLAEVGKHKTGFSAR